MCCEQEDINIEYDEEDYYDNVQYLYYNDFPLGWHEYCEEFYDNEESYHYNE